MSYLRNVVNVDEWLEKIDVQDADARSNCIPVCDFQPLQIFA